MALSDLLSALREQAADHRTASLEHAQADAERIRVESAAALDRRRVELLSKVEREEDEAAQRALSRALAGASQTVLTSRVRLLERVRAAAAARIRGAGRDPAYLESLPGELESAIDRLPPGPVVVRAPPSLVGAVDGATRHLGFVTVEPSESSAVGFEVSSSDGRIQIDGTLEARLAHSWPRLAVEVLREAEP